jgi:hypothetical protein
MPPSKINVLGAVDRKVNEVFHPFIVGDVNESQVKVAKFGPSSIGTRTSAKTRLSRCCADVSRLIFAMASQKWAKVTWSSSGVAPCTGPGRFRRNLSF